MTRYALIPLTGADLHHARGPFLSIGDALEFIGYTPDYRGGIRNLRPLRKDMPGLWAIVPVYP